MVSAVDAVPLTLNEDRHVKDGGELNRWGSSLDHEGKGADRERHRVAPDADPLRRPPELTDPWVSASINRLH
jgi:hypothetical protein